MWKTKSIYVLAACILLTVCGSQETKIIFQPAPRDENHVNETWLLIDSKNSKTAESIPEWVNLYLNNSINEMETREQFINKYLFIGHNRGDNFIALNQWATAFTAEQDLPMLAAARIEKKMISAAALYPDDEYGDFFELFIKAAIDAQYGDAKIEDNFWVRRLITITDQTNGIPAIEECYDFLIMISADKGSMQNRIRGIMNEINTPVKPSREQAAAINRIKQNFFEGF